MYAYDIPDREEWLKSARINGNFINEITGEDLDFHEIDHYPSDPSTGDPEYWEVEATDGKRYQIVGDEILDGVGNVVGHFDPLTDPDPDRDSDRDSDFYSVWDGPDHEAKVVESDTAVVPGYSFAPGGTSLKGAKAIPGMGLGRAIMPDVQSPEEIQAMLEGMDDPKQKEYREWSKGMTPWKDYMKRFDKGGGKEAADPAQPSFQNIPTGDESALENPGGVKYNEGFVLVSKWASTDQAHYMLDPRCRGIVAGAGGMSSHGVVVARERGYPCVVDVEGWTQIKPGDFVMVDGNTGQVHVNGFDESVNRSEEQATAAMGVVRFIWSQGNRMDAEIPQHNPEAGKLHSEMIMELAGQGQWDFNDAALGVIFDNGNAQIVTMGLSDMPALEEWLRSLGAKSFQVGEDMSAIASSEDGKAKRKCPKCGSHTIRLVNSEKDHSVANLRCLTCGNEWKLKGILKNPESHVAASKYTPGTRVQITKPGYSGRGSVLESSGTDKNFDEELYDILLDNGDKMEKVPESAFKRIKSAGEYGDSTAAYFVDTMSDENPSPNWHGYSLSNTGVGDANSPTTLPMYQDPNFIRVNPDFKAGDSEPTLIKGMESFPNVYELVGLNTDTVYARGSRPQIEKLQREHMGQEGLHESGLDDREQLCKCGHPLTSHEEAGCRECAGSNDPNVQVGHAFTPAIDTDWQRDFNPSNPTHASIQKEAPGDKHLPYATPKRNRQYEHILQSCKEEHPDYSEERCKELAASTVNKQRAEHGETKDSAAKWPWRGMCTNCGSHKLYNMGQQADGSVHYGCFNCGKDTVVNGDYASTAPDTHGIVDGGQPENELVEPGYDPRYSPLDEDPEQSFFQKWKNKAFGSVQDLQGQPLEPGRTYTMYGQNYKVPDIIHVLNADEGRVEAAIQGDTKGHFPIVLTPEEIESKGYTFEPYEQRQSNWKKVASKKLTTKEQLELINENPEGKARNIDKMDLDGTHYVSASKPQTWEYVGPSNNEADGIYFLW